MGLALTRSTAIRAATLIAASVLLAGCSASNLSSYLADTIPHWMGGLPSDAPPRQNDPRFADYYRTQLAAREKAATARAQLDQQDARIKSAESDYDHLMHAQTMQSARRQMPAQPVGEELAQETPADSFSMSASALY
jgi:major membrane immunogen (membrane-anchored lipoprotein)